jgi:uncharacterized protein (DUF2147 family)
MARPSLRQLLLTAAACLEICAALSGSRSLAKAAGQPDSTREAPGTGRVEGLWLSQDGEAIIEISRFDDRLRGRIVWLQDSLGPSGQPRLDTRNPQEVLRGHSIIGLVILDGFASEPDRKGAFSGGTIYDPKVGRTYRCVMKLEGRARLKIRGYVGLRALGRTTVWTRPGLD